MGNARVHTMTNRGKLQASNERLYQDIKKKTSQRKALLISPLSQKSERFLIARKETLKNDRVVQLQTIV